MELLPILGAHAEPPSVFSQVADPTPVYIRNRLLLEPVPVAYEVLERHGLGVRDAVEGTVAIEFQSTLGIIEIRSTRARAQEHSPRHMPFPELHRLAEDPSLDVLGVEVRGGRQSVRPRADDRDVTRRIAVPHGSFPGLPSGELL